MTYIILCKICTENKPFLLILHLVIKRFLFCEILSCNFILSNRPYIHVIMIVITQLFIHTFIHSFNHSFNHSFVHSLMYTSIRWFTHPPIYHKSTNPCIYSYNSRFGQSLIHSFSDPQFVQLPKSTKVKAPGR